MRICTLTNSPALVFALALVAHLPAHSHAQCPGQCGDMNASGTMTPNDATLLFNWIFHQVPPPQPIECGEVDYHQNITIHDPQLLIDWLLHCDGCTMACNPMLPPQAPLPSDSVLIWYDDRFPAGDSQVVFDLMYQLTPDEFWRNGMALPFLVDVSGDVPEVEVLQTDLDSLWAWDTHNTNVQGAPPGHALLGLMYGGGYGPIRLARIRITLPPSAVDRSIHLQWTTLPPHNVATVTRLANSLDPTDDHFPPYEPHLFPCRVHVTGDLQEDGGTSSADIIVMVNFVFKGDAPPSPCAATADVDCSGVVTSADLIKLINYVFKAGTKPCNVCEMVADGDWACP